MTMTLVDHGRLARPNIDNFRLMRSQLLSQAALPCGYLELLEHPVRRLVRPHSERTTREGRRRTRCGTTCNYL